MHFLRVCIISFVYISIVEVSLPSKTNISKESDSTNTKKTRKNTEDCTDKYEIDSTRLGSGGFGTVYMARIETRKYALKVNDDISEHNREAKVLTRIEKAYRKSKNTHRYTPRYYGECMYEEFKKALIMEFVPNEFSTATNDKVDLLTKISLIYQLLSAIAQIHSSGFAHLDIKPDNIGIGDDGLLKIIDFGTACPDKANSISYFHGTPAYGAPEALIATGDEPADIYHADAWSVGAIVFEILTGRQLIDDAQMDDIVKCIATDPETKTITPSETHQATCMEKLVYTMLKSLFYDPSVRLYHDSESDELHEDTSFESDCPVEFRCLEYFPDDGIEEKMSSFYIQLKSQNVISDGNAYLLQNMLHNLLAFDAQSRDTVTTALAHPIFHHVYSTMAKMPMILPIQYTYSLPTMPGAPQPASDIRNRPETPQATPDSPSDIVFLSQEDISKNIHEYLDPNN